MRCTHARTGAGLLTLSIFLIGLMLWKVEAPATVAEAQPTVLEQPVAMPGQLTGVLITLGLKDEKVTDWNGQISISAGKILDLTVVQGNPKALVKGATFGVRTIFNKMGAKKDGMTRSILRLTVDAPRSAKVQVKTEHGDFEFVLDEVPAATRRLVLGGQVALQREEAAMRLTATDMESDYPALARGADGTVWLAYCEYQRGEPYVKERVLAGSFDDLVPKRNGDRIRLKRFDGMTWGKALAVTEGGLDIWRPAVTVAKGHVHVSWSQQVAGNWDIYHRVYSPPGKAEGEGRWSETVRVTTNPGTDYSVASATASGGDVWLTWLSWEKGFFQIHGRKLELAPAGNKIVLLGNERAFSETKANHWSPAMAADARGRVYVAYDTYAKGNYDVHVAEITGTVVKSVPIATSARFEARPSIVCDSEDRVWVSYEEGDEQWGKDYANAAFRKIGFQENPGNALYVNRTVQVKCLVDGKVMQPQGDLQKAIAEATARNRSVPRLAVDGPGGLWLLYRHHPRPLGVGEVWNSFAVRYDGKKWSEPRRLAQSENLMDNRPALVALDQGMLVVFSGDRRINQQNRQRDDLYATVLIGSGGIVAPALVAGPPAAAPELKTVHPHEAADIARMRAYRLDHEGKKLRLFRGEFHRHTEYTAHRDQDGLLEDSWRYALDAGNLDWMGNADHDNGHHDEYSWWQIQKMADLMHNAPAFVAIQSYERSVVYPNGHRNVILPRRGIRPLPRGILKGTEEAGTPDTKTLYQYLKHFGGMCSSHTSATNMGTDWRDNDPIYEPVVEVYQGHRHNYEHFGAPRAATPNTQIGGYEPKGFIWNALEKGYKLGFQASSDHVSTHMSYGVVLTDDLSRQGIIDAFKRRHSYAATDNIILEFRCGKHLMGDIFETKTAPTFDIKVLGTAPVTRLSIVRDNKYIHVASPNKSDVTLTYTDQDAPAGKMSYYYVRIEQQDGNLAWASPMWITRK